MTFEELDTFENDVVLKSDLDKDMQYTNELVEDFKELKFELE